MTVKVSIAAITSTVMAISMQVHAGEKLSVDSASATDWSDQVNNALRNKDSKEAIRMAMLNLSQNIIVDGKQSPIDVSVILQNRNDSTNAFGSSGDPGLARSQVTTCYTNCHSACHGSRNWR